jgi:S-(hydroxymethyl)glutathione dehydrogenase / alcohol dehydrogenase
MKFSAAILRELRQPLTVEELEVPLLSIGQVLVRVTRSGICGAQLGEIAGVKGDDKYLPHLMGHEGAGIVHDIGEGVTHVKVGDHVVMHWRKGQGIEGLPPKYRTASGETIGGGWVTTFNEMAVVSENRLTAIPKDIPLVVGALLGCAITTALGIINNEAKVKFGQSVAVIGCGGVGLGVIRAAQMAGAHPIIGIDRVGTKAQKAYEFGASIAAAKIEVIREYCPRGADVIIDTTGAPEAIEEAWAQTASPGKLILVAQMAHDRTAAIQTLPMQAGRVLIGSDGGGTNPTVDIPRYVKLLQAKKLNLDGYLTIADRFPIFQINQALDRLRSGEAVRCMIDMEEMC